MKIPTCPFHHPLPISHILPGLKRYINSITIHFPADPWPSSIKEIRVVVMNESKAWRGGTGTAVWGLQPNCPMGLPCIPRTSRHPHQLLI
jgi:hypothetical protein